ncbi:MAG: SPOR domain-containing protein [Gemmatimonadota bacterium]
MHTDSVPFDPLAGTASPAMAALLASRASQEPVLLLAVGAGAQRTGWAARAAVAIAAAFAQRGERLILADLSLHKPELHVLLGTENEEGLSDVFLFGASLQHIMHTIPGQQFRLVPASPFTPDPVEVLTHARWGALFEELASSRSKLFVYTPIDVDGVAALSDRVGHAIVLAEADELNEVRARLSEHVDVIATLAPPAPTPSAPRRDDADFEKIRIPKDGAREALIADLRSRQRAALMAPPPTVTPPSHEEEAASGRLSERGTGHGQVFRLPAPHPALPPKRRWTGWIITVVLLAAAGGTAWYLYDTRFPAPAPAPATATAPATAPGTVPATATATAPGTVPATATATATAKMPYSVAIASYQVLNLAQERVDQLTDDEPGLSFYIGPIVLQGTLFYRVMAGPVPDSGTAAALRDTLISKRIKTITSGWDVLSTPYAFLLGEYTSRGSAQAQQRSAASKGVPSYIVEITSPDGSAHHRLYAGAYTGPGDAEFMRPILKAAGLPENLVERIGSIRT